jgi:hypothetical protein
MLRKYFFLMALVATLPLAAQDWDIRLEVPFPKGQSLQGTMIAGALDLYTGDTDTGNGAILSVYRRIIRFGPVLRLDWGGEIAQMNASGDIKLENSTSTTKLRQTGLGVGVNAQVWIPFTGIGGEFGVIQRFQQYRFKAAGEDADHSTIGRTWLRVGVRYRLPIPVINPYLSASYQQPINKDNPVKVNSISDLAGYLAAQGSGQEFNRMWTFGIGVTF